jgi:hypothetical protein
MNATATIRTARKRWLCDRTIHTQLLQSNGIDQNSNPMYGKPCLKNDEPIQPGDKYAEAEGWDEFHPAHYHVECWEDES